MSSWRNPLGRDYPRAVAEYLREVGRERGETWTLKDCIERERSVCHPDFHEVRCPAPKSAMDALLCLHEVGHAATYDSARKDVEYSHVLSVSARDLRTEAEAWLWALRAWRRLGGSVRGNASLYAVAYLGTYFRGHWLRQEEANLYREERSEGAIRIVKADGPPSAQAELERRVNEHLRMVRVIPILRELRRELAPEGQLLLGFLESARGWPLAFKALAPLWRRFSIKEPKLSKKKVDFAKAFARMLQTEPKPTRPWPYP